MKTGMREERIKEGKQKKMHKLLELCLRTYKRGEGKKTKNETTAKKNKTRQPTIPSREVGIPIYIVNMCGK